MLDSGSAVGTLTTTVYPLSANRKMAGWVIIQAPITNTASVRVLGFSQSGGAVPATGGYEIQPGGDLTLPALGTTSPYNLQNVFFVVGFTGERVDYVFGSA